MTIRRSASLTISAASTTPRTAMSSGRRCIRPVGHRTRCSRGWRLPGAASHSWPIRCCPARQRLVRGRRGRYSSMAPPTPLVPTGLAPNPLNTNGFTLVDGEIRTYGSSDFGLLYYTRSAFADFTLRAEFKILASDIANGNSGIFVRFRDPLLDPTAATMQRIQAAGHQDLFNTNRAWSAVHSGFEIQIDDLGRPDGLQKHRTGAIYDLPAGDLLPDGALDPIDQIYQAPPNLIPGRWYQYEIDVRGDTYTVDLTDLVSQASVRTSSFTNPDPARGVPVLDGQPAGYIGLQSYSNAPTAFRHISVRP